MKNSSRKIHLSCSQVRGHRKRRGAVAVEFAIVAPVLVAITVGMLELTRIFDTQNLLESAAREGARFASIDKDGLLQGSQDSNSKLVNDVKNFLDSNGVGKDSVQVEILDFENPGKTFDLDDPANELRLFEVRVSVDYSSVSLTPVGGGDNYMLAAAVVFRNGLATISE
jgi:Flp pilus assembly protein TadG